METVSLEKRVMQCRLLVWLTTLFIAYTLFREDSPAAWQVAAFAALFTLLWPLARRSTASHSAETNTTPHLVEISVDLVALTLLINVSGGFESAFAPLLFFIVAEVYTLLGAQKAVYAALAAALLSLMHARSGVSVHAVILYGFALGTLLVSTILTMLRQRAVGEEDAIFEGRTAVRRQPKANPPVNASLESLEESYQQLKTSYRDVAQLSREQRSEIERLRIGETLFALSAVSDATENRADAFAQLVRAVMDAMDAGGGALWLRFSNDDTLRVVASEGRIAPRIRESVISYVADLLPSEIREKCEEPLRAAAPSTASVMAIVTRPHAVSSPEPMESASSDDTAPTHERDLYITAPIAHPVTVVLLREPTHEPNTVGAILGILGLCDPRGAARFSHADNERFEGLANAFAVALKNVLRRRGQQRQLRELSLRYDFSRLAQKTGHSERFFESVLEQANQLLPYENGTLFLLNEAENRLEAKATRGRLVNLLDQFTFERGEGVSGWVASHGRLLSVPDLTEERNLFSGRTLPPRIRSFASIPLKVQDQVLGVLHISHSQAHAFPPADLQLLAQLAGQTDFTPTASLSHSAIFSPADPSTTLTAQAVVPALQETLPVPVA